MKIRVTYLDDYPYRDDFVPDGKVFNNWDEVTGFLRNLLSMEEYKILDIEKEQ